MDVDRSETTGADDDARTVLREIGAEAAVARLEARISGLEQAFGHVAERQRAADRARWGDLELMRARVDDLTAVVHESLVDRPSQNHAAVDLELSDLRERLQTVRSEVRAVDRQLEEVAAFEARWLDVARQLAERLEQAEARQEESDTRERDALEGERRNREEAVGDVAASVGELGAELERVRNDLRAESSSRVSELSGRVDQLLEDTTADVAATAEDLNARIDRIRHELRSDAAAELEKLGTRLERVRAELRAESAGQVEDLSTEMERTRDELRTESAASAADLAQRLEGVREELGAESASGLEALEARLQQTRDELGAEAAKLGDLTGEVAQLSATVSGETAARQEAIDQVAAEVGELGTRLEDLAKTVTNALKRLTHQFSTRVSTLASEQAALREEQDAVAASVGELAVQVGALEGEQRQLGAAAQANENRVQALGGELEGVDKRITEAASTLRTAVAHLRRLTERVEAVEQHQHEQELLPRDVSALDARVGELVIEIGEVERVARGAADAIIAARRRAQQRAQSKQSPASGEGDTPGARNGGPVQGVSMDRTVTS